MNTARSGRAGIHARAVLRVTCKPTAIYQDCRQLCTDDQRRQYINARHSVQCPIVEVDGARRVESSDDANAARESLCQCLERLRRWHQYKRLCTLGRIRRGLKLELCFAAAGL